MRQGELLLGKLRELEGREVKEKQLFATGENDQDQDGDLHSGSDMSSEEDEEGEEGAKGEEGGEGEEGEEGEVKEDGKDGAGLAALEAIIGGSVSDGTYGGGKDSKTLNTTVEPLDAADLGLNFALHTLNGRKLLTQSFWCVKTKVMDHFGKIHHGRIWPDEMRRLLREETGTLSKHRVVPRHNTVMWRLRDGFERYEESCFSSHWNASSGAHGSGLVRCLLLFFFFLLCCLSFSSSSLSLSLSFLLQLAPFS